MSTQDLVPPLIDSPPAASHDVKQHSGVPANAAPVPTQGEPVLKTAEVILSEAGALQRAIFNSANFSSIATDASGVIQIFNVGAERMLGYTAAEVMNTITPADISDPAELIARAEELSIELRTPITPGFEALVFKASRGIEDIYELTYIRKDSTRFPAIVSVTALRDAVGTIIGYLLIGTDNTARQQIEAERQRLDQALLDKNAELERAKIAAEEANLAKSDFLSSMSHELRSPLNAILGFAQLINSDPLRITDEQQESVRHILRAGWYLLELINEILDLALIESGKTSLVEESVSLVDILLECQALVEPMAAKRDIRLELPRVDAPRWVSADRTRLKQVLVNLLTNAIKYNRPSGVVVIEFTARLPRHIRVSIRDTGAGIAPERLPELFQSFNRLGRESGVEEGTGIGLVVSKRLIELMGGSIGVESTVGTGSVFWFELHAAAAAAPEPSRQPSLSPIAEVPARAFMPLSTVLYVEDNPANLKLVEKLIARRRDLLLLSAMDAKTGIELARDKTPDVILMDLQLPSMSGLEAIRILREDPLTGHIPVIAVSAFAMPRDIHKGMQAGFFRYITKPIKIDELMEALDMAMDHSRALERFAVPEI